MSLEYGDNFIGQTTMRDYNFTGLFYSATTLTDASNLILPATTLTQRCYRSMFARCSNLTATPVLSAATLVSQCYYQMFMNCSSLTNVSCLATDISASQCTYNWFAGASSSGTFVKAASMTGWTSGYSGIPSGWTIVDYSA